MAESSVQTVLITGASTGLGLALAHRLVSHSDYRLVLTARDSSLSRFDEEGFSECNRVIIRPMRVNTDDERREVIREIEDRWGGVDILVNNAGVAYRSVVEHLGHSELERQMEINFEAPLQLIRLVLPWMRSQRNGRIINVSSVSGMLAMPTMAPYSASKWALEGVTEALWYETRPWNIHVSLVQPGFIRSDSFQNTRMTEASQQAFESPDDAYYQHYLQMDRLIARFMNQAIATPQSVAKRIHNVMKRNNPPLRVPVTLDAHLFSMMRRFFPRQVFHHLLYRTLPNIRRWGKIT
tara:strand:- start:4187 stop:5071 length:885 start_codon:yes stop_codon:yes gene_type:complete